MQPVIKNPVEEAGGGVKTPSSILSARSWVDMRDLTTMWTTSARTTPATAGSYCGSVKDKITGDYWYQPTDAKRPTVNALATGTIYNGSSTFLATPKGNWAWAVGAGANVRVFAVVALSEISAWRAIVGGYYGFWGFELGVYQSKLRVIAGDGVANLAIKSSTDNVPTVLCLTELAFDNTGNTIAPVINNGSRTDTTGFSYNIGFYSTDLVVSLGASAQSAGGAAANYLSGSIFEEVAMLNPTTQHITDLMTYFKAHHPTLTI